MSGFSVPGSATQDCRLTRELYHVHEARSPFANKTPWLLGLAWEDRYLLFVYRQALFLTVYIHIYICMYLYTNLISRINVTSQFR
ncbi:hypothetical protein BDV18DRAFT_56215 [Aspergillus unguis]